MIRVLLCPPLFFARRKRWFSFLVNGILYAYCLLSIIAGLYGLIAGTERLGLVPIGIVFWLLGLAHVVAARRREKAQA